MGLKLISSSLHEVCSVKVIPVFVYLAGVGLCVEQINASRGAGVLGGAHASGGARASAGAGA